MQITISDDEHKDIRQRLNSILEILHKAGITSNQEIIEYIAYSLLKMTGKFDFIPERFKPQPPRSGYGGYESEVTGLLEEAVALAHGAANLFDSYVLFQEFDVARKDSYFIPRHIVRFMLQTLNIQDTETFADFTCGSGGFLVNRYTNSQQAHSGRSFGIDINPEVLRIAYANVELHDLASKIDLLLGDSFYECNEGALAGSKFNSIAMAPPFGITINQKTSKWTMNFSSGRASEQLFTRLALEKLSEKGRAIIMVPNSLLTTNQRTEALKQDIFNNHTLRAVISLGTGALYPFNRQDIGLLLLEKAHSPTTQSWLFNVEKDGYTRSAKRDITRDPEANDFAPILDALNMTNFHSTIAPKGLSNSPTTSAPSPVFFAFVQIQDERGYLLKSDEQAVLQSIWLIEENPQGLSSPPHSYLFAQVTYLSNYPVRYFVFPFNEQEPVPESMLEVEANRWLEQLATNRNGFVVFDNKDNIPGLTVVILPDGRLLGCTRPVKNIEQAQYDLRPHEYLQSLSPKLLLTREQLRLPPEKGEALKQLAGGGIASFRVKESEKSPTTLLSEVKQQQALVNRHVDNLSGLLEMRLFKELPPRKADALATLYVLDYLDDGQKAIWEKIQQFIDAEQHPYHFTRSKLHGNMEPDQQDVVKLQSTLDLLVQLGVIVRVYVDAQVAQASSPKTLSRTTRGVVYYRLVASHDIKLTQESVHE